MPLKPASNDNLKWQMIAFPLFFSFVQKSNEKYNFSCLDENRNCLQWMGLGLGGWDKEGDFPKNPRELKDLYWLTLY